MVHKTIQKAVGKANNTTGTTFKAVEGLRNKGSLLSTLLFIAFVIGIAIVVLWVLLTIGVFLNSPTDLPPVSPELAEGLQKTFGGAFNG